MTLNSTKTLWPLFCILLPSVIALRFKHWKVVEVKAILCVTKCSPRSLVLAICNTYIPIFLETTWKCYEIGLRPTFTKILCMYVWNIVFYLYVIGVVHKGRPQKFGDFYLPPLSAFVHIWLTPPSLQADVRICIVLLCCSSHIQSAAFKRCVGQWPVSCWRWMA